MSRSAFILVILLFMPAAYASTFKGVLEPYDPCEFKLIFVNKNDNNHIQILLPDTGLVADAVVGGTLIGKHHGKLVSVTPKEITIVEIWPKSDDGYSEVTVRLTIGNELAGNITSCSRSQPSAAGTPQSGAP